MNARALFKRYLDDNPKDWVAASAGYGRSVYAAFKAGLALGPDPSEAQKREWMAEGVLRAARDYPKITRDMVSRSSVTVYLNDYANELRSDHD